MNKRKLNEITRISHSDVIEPTEYWALYADAYYEDLFSEIEERDDLLNTYKHWLKKVPSGKPRAALTFFYRLRRDELDEKFDWSLIEHLEKKVTEFVKLFENPDGIYYKRKNLSFNDKEQAIAFGQHKGKMYVVRKPGMTHGEITYEPKPGQTAYFDRINFKYPGRLWYEDKIISFWIYPSIKEMPKILQDLEKAVKETLDISLGLLSDPEWRIEIITGKEYDADAPVYNFDWRGYVNTDIIPLKDYIGSEERSAEEKAKAHVMSPMEKAKKLTSKSSAYFKHQKRKPLAWRQAMQAESYNDIKFPRLKLFEDPDTVEMEDNYEVEWHEVDAYPFGYLDGRMYIGNASQIHGDIVTYDGIMDRKNYTYPGRIWIEDKVMSFWEYPPAEKMRKVLYDIEENFKENKDLNLNLISDSRWKIELADGTIVSLKDYIGSEERSAEEKAKAHVMSPMEKAKKLTSKSSAYFKSQKRKPLPWRQAMYAESKKSKYVSDTINEYLKNSYNVKKLKT